MSETKKKTWEEGFEEQINALNAIEESFGTFAKTLRDRHLALEGEVPKVEMAVSEIKTALDNAARKSERAAQEIDATAGRLLKDSGGQFAAWQAEAEKVKAELGKVAESLTDNVQNVERTLAGVQEALAGIKAVEETVFGGIKDAVDGVRSSVDRNTMAKVGDYAGALQQKPSVAPEEIEKIRNEIASLRTALDEAKKEILAARKQPDLAGKELTNQASSEGVKVLAGDVSEVKSMLFEMLRYLKEVSDRKLEVPNIEVKAPEPPPPGTPEELAERLASGYRDLIKLVAKKS